MSWKLWEVTTKETVERRYEVRAQSPQQAMKLVEEGDRDPVLIIDGEEQVTKRPREVSSQATSEDLRGKEL